MILICTPGEVPKVLPAGWKGPELDRHEMQGFGYEMNRYRSPSGLRVIHSIDHLEKVGKEGDGTWEHLSISRSNRLPSWSDLKEAKEIFMGDVLVIQVMPPREYWINVAEHCLHLFRRLDGETCPEPLWRYKK